MRDDPSSGRRPRLPQDAGLKAAGRDACRYAARFAVLLSINSLHAESAYDQVIARIFRARCTECHGEQKQKAKLALHTWEGLMRGSDAGPVLVAGKPGESPLIERVHLPVSDEDHMPPADHAQPSAEEIQLLTHWVEKGASRTATVAELDLPAPLAQAARVLPEKLKSLASAAGNAEPLWEFDPAAVAKVRAPLAAKVTELQRKFPGALSYESRTSAALLFTAVGFGADFNDAQLAALAPLRDQLVSLDVSGTGVTDASAAVLRTFAKLRVLRAGYTALGDSTVEALAALPVLQSLSLSGTRITEASVTRLSRLRGLKSLRVADTAAAQPAQAANLPVVPTAADLLAPEPEPPPAKSDPMPAK